MILNPTISQRHNRPQGYRSLRRASVTRYAISARQVRNACVLGCLGGFAFIAFACWALG